MSKSQELSVISYNSVPKNKPNSLLNTIDLLYKELEEFAKKGNFAVVFNLKQFTDSHLSPAFLPVLIAILKQEGFIVEKYDEASFIICWI